MSLILDACEASVGWMRWVWLTDFGPATALRNETSELSAGFDCVVLLQKSLMQTNDGCSRLGVANFGHRWHHDFGSRSRGCPREPRGGQRVKAYVKDAGGRIKTLACRILARSCVRG